ncbi:hypothetical protein BGX38DRAFT_1160684, partial [Terfezia claveryi]
MGKGRVMVGRMFPAEGSLLATGMGILIFVYSFLFVSLLHGKYHPALLSLPLQSCYIFTILLLLHGLHVIMREPS